VVSNNKKFLEVQEPFYKKVLGRRRRNEMVVSSVFNVYGSGRMGGGGDAWVFWGRVAAGAEEGG
jgi:hypothetical protein